MRFDAYAALYVDVDGTLLLWPGDRPGRVPRRGEPHYGEPPAVNTSLVTELKRWHQPPRTLVIWSHGGAAHAAMAANLCGLSPAACLPKPSCAIDDASEKRLKQFGVVKP